MRRLPEGRGSHGPTHADSCRGMLQVQLVYVAGTIIRHTVVRLLVSAHEHVPHGSIIS